MVRPQYDFSSFEEFLGFLQTSKNYLEKANCNDLGDFTPEGKVRNAGCNNYTVYWKWYKELGYGNLQGEAYCAGGVSTMFTSGFGLEKAKKLLCGDLYVYCPTGYEQFCSKGRSGSTPKVGAVVFFWSDSLKRWSHTGIVIGVDSNKQGYTTWEANTTAGNDVVVRNGGATCIKHYTLDDRKVAFGYPDYAGNGISTDGCGCNTNKLDEYEVGTYGAGLKCTTNSLNIRNIPGKDGSTVIGTITKGAYIVPSKKCFVDGKAWYYIPARKGWVSADYFTGWVQEKSDCDKWWYLLPGYKYYVNQIAYIDDKYYFFGPDGYMFIGTLTLETDASGALKVC